MPDGASSGDCAVPKPAGAGRVHELFDTSPLLAASTRCARRGEFSDNHCALRTLAAVRYFEITTFMTTFMQSLRLQQRRFSHALERNGKRARAEPAVAAVG